MLHSRSHWYVGLSLFVGIVKLMRALPRRRRAIRMIIAVEEEIMPYKVIPLQLPTGDSSDEGDAINASGYISSGLPATLGIALQRCCGLQPEPRRRFRTSIRATLAPTMPRIIDNTGESIRC